MQLITGGMHSLDGHQLQLDAEHALPPYRCHVDINRCKSGAVYWNACLELEDVKVGSGTDFPSDSIW